MAAVQEPERKSGALELVLDRHRVAEAFQTPYRERWLRYYRLYRNFRDERFTITKNNNFVPIAFSIIETVQPRLTAAVLDQRPFVVAFPREEGDVEQAKLVTDLLDYQFFRISADVKISRWIKEALLYGTSVIKVFWNAERDVRASQEQREAAPADVFKRNDPDIANVDLWDFFVDPMAFDIESARYCIHKLLKDRERVIEEGKRRGYKNLDRLMPGSSQTEKDETKQERLAAIGVAEPSQFQDKDTSKVEILDYWEADRHIVIANRSILLLDEPNPFWHKRKPFLAIKDHEVPHEFYGIGEIEAIESLHNKLLDYRNKVEDNLDQTVHRMWLAQRGSNINADHLVSRAGGIIWTDDVNALQPLRVPDVSSGAIAVISLIKNEIQEATGLFDVVKGFQESKSPATTTIALQQAAGNRFAQKVRNIKSQGIKPLAEMFWQLSVQFLPEESVVRILGPKGRNYAKVFDPTDFQFRKVTKQEIRIQPDFVPVGIDEPEGNRQIRQQRYLQFIQILGQVPPDRIAAFMPIIESLGRELQIPNVDEIIRAFQGLPIVQMPPMAPGMEGAQAPPGVPGGEAPIPGSPDVGQQLSGEMEAAEGLGETGDLVAGQLRRIQEAIAG